MSSDLSIDRRRGDPRFPMRRVTSAAGVLLLAALAGGLAAALPDLALGLLGLAGVVLLVMAAPVAHFAILIAITALVPYDLQREFAPGIGGTGSGLQVADLLMITGFARAAFALARQPLDRRRAIAVAITGLFLLLVLLQAVRGWQAGYDHSQVAYEARELLSWGTFLIALPLIGDPRHSGNVLKALLVIGILSGLWGIAQWAIQIPFGGANDAGVQSGVALTSNGQGQVQGGLFAFPVALLIAIAVLVAGRVASVRVRAALVAIVALNAVSELLTYERTFWVATVAGVLVILLKSDPGARTKALASVVGLAVLVFAVLATIAPGELATARERLLSIGQYGTDSSVRYRIGESRVVLSQVSAHPLLGSGTGATIFWGQPYDRVPPSSTPFSHNAELWLAWKLGIPAVVLLLALVIWAIVARGPPDGTAWLASARTGAQATLFAMLIVSVTFPSLAERPITPTLGLLLALGLAGGPGSRRDSARAPGREWRQSALRAATEPPGDA